MEQTNTQVKPLHQLYSDLDNRIFSAFCDSFSGVNWMADFKDNEDVFCGVDLQLTAQTNSKLKTYDVEIKSVHLNKLLDYCFFEWKKWFSLNQWDNDVKLYCAIYVNLNKIAVWRVNNELFDKSEKDLTTMKRNTCKGDVTKEKKVYKFKLSDAKVFDFDLTNYKQYYNALNQQRTKKSN